MKSKAKGVNDSGESDDERAIYMKNLKHKSEQSLWSELKPIGKNINRRAYHSAIIYNNQLYIYGGYEANLGVLQDFQTIPLVAGQQQFSWRDLTPSNLQDSEYFFNKYPGPLRNHTAVVYGKKMLILGGLKKSLCASSILWSYDFHTSQWSQLSNLGETQIEGHSSLIWNNYLVSYAGFYSGNKTGYSSRVLVYNVETNEWDYFFNHSNKPDNEEGKRYPFKRAGAGIALCGDSIYIFGGTNVQHRYDDFWKFNLIEKTWNQIIVAGYRPQSRSSPTLIKHPTQEVLILFGGIHDITHEKNDLSIYKIQNNQWSNYEEDTSHKTQQQNFLDDSKLFQQDMKQGGSPNLTQIRQKSPIKISPKRLEKQYKPFRQTGQNNMVIGQQQPSNNSIDDKNGLNNLEEQRKKKWLAKKQDLLSQFELNEKEQKNFRCSSPITDQMKNAIEAVVNENDDKNQQISKSFKNLNNKTISNENLPTFYGSKPCARDGHTALVFNNQMIIFGGDRHLMSFADIFVFQLGRMDL